MKRILSALLLVVSFFMITGCTEMVTQKKNLV